MRTIKNNKLSKLMLHSPIAALLVIALLLSTIMYLRYYDDSPIFPNGEVYYALRMTAELAKDPFYFEDTLQQRPYYSSTYHYAIAIASRTLGNELLFIIPLGLALLSATLYYALLLMLGLPRKNSALTTMMLAVTPAFTAAFTTISIHAFTLFLSLLTLVLYFQKNYWDYPWKVSGKLFYAGSIASLSLLAVTSLLGFAMTVMMLFALSALEKRSFKSVLLATILPFLILIPVFAYTNYLANSFIHSGFHAFGIKESFSIFGSANGLDFFLFILYIIGLVILWSFIREMRLLHVLSLAVIILSLTNPLIRLFASLIIAVYCVIAIKHLYFRKWELQAIKTGTIILVACALLFSMLSQASALVNAEPKSQTITLLEDIKGKEAGAVLTGPEYGFIVQWASNLPVLLDWESKAHPGYKEAENDYKALLETSRVKDAIPLLQKNKIRFILITPMMKEELWLGKEEKLLLLLRNSPSFTLIGSTPSGFEMWEYSLQGSN
jgi:hypothetical protein